MLGEVDWIAGRARPEVAEAKKDNRLGLMVAGFRNYAEERAAQG